MTAITTTTIASQAKELAGLVPGATLEMAYATLRPLNKGKRYALLNSVRVDLLTLTPDSGRLTLGEGRPPIDSLKWKSDVNGDYYLTFYPPTCSDCEKPCLQGRSVCRDHLHARFQEQNYAPLASFPGAYLKAFRHHTGAFLFGLEVEIDGVQEREYELTESPIIAGCCYDGSLSDGGYEYQTKPLTLDLIPQMLTFLGKITESRDHYSGGHIHVSRGRGQTAMRWYYALKGLTEEQCDMLNMRHMMGHDVRYRANGSYWCELKKDFTGKGTAINDEHRTTIELRTFGRWTAETASKLIDAAEYLSAMWHFFHRCSRMKLKNADIERFSHRAAASVINHDITLEEKLENLRAIREQRRRKYLTERREAIMANIEADKLARKAHHYASTRRKLVRQERKRQQERRERFAKWRRLRKIRLDTQYLGVYSTEYARDPVRRREEIINEYVKMYKRGSIPYTPDEINVYDYHAHRVCAYSPEAVQAMQRIAERRAAKAKDNTVTYSCQEALRIIRKQLKSQGRKLNLRVSYGFTPVTL